MGGATGRGEGGLDQKGLVLQAVSREKRLWASRPSQNTCRDSLDSQTSGPTTSTLPPRGMPVRAFTSQ